MSARTWYYMDGAERRGPISELALRDLANQRLITAATMVHTAGLKDWRAAGSIKGLIPAILDVPGSVAGPQAPQPASERQWFYCVGAERVGPIGEPLLRELIASGVASERSLVWSAGMTEWVPSGTIPELRVRQSTNTFSAEERSRHVPAGSQRAAGGEDPSRAQHPPSQVSPPVGIGIAHALFSGFVADHWPKAAVRWMVYQSVALCFGFVLRAGMFARAYGKSSGAYWSEGPGGGTVSPRRPLWSPYQIGGVYLTDYWILIWVLILAGPAVWVWRKPIMRALNKNAE